MMARFFCCFLVLFFLCLVGATCRLLATNDGFAVNNNRGTLQHSQSLKINQTENEGLKEVEETTENRGMKKIGSGPPSCEHKCYGCMPCEAIQVPTKTTRVKVQYTNYEPEGWKCKCGPTFYSP